VPDTPLPSSEPSDLPSASPGLQNPLSQTYQLTVKRGFLALFVMYASQTLVGVGLSYGIRFIQGAFDDAGSIDFQVIGMASVLIGGVIVLLWIWSDIRRFGASFLPQIGLRQSVVKTSHAVVLVFLLLGGTHFLAWLYRSAILPSMGQGGIIGGGSQMFAHIQETGGIFEMAGFLVLALLVGPVMEEVVFRGVPAICIGASDA
jgi:hypothetical protein